MGEENVHFTQDENLKGGNIMGNIASLIPMALGIGSSLLGKGKGKKTEYAAQAPEYQQQFSEDFMKFLQGQIGQGATPYGGQVAASAMNPFTQSALGLWGASPYGQMGGGMPQQPQMPMGQLGGGLMGGQPPGGAPQMPMTLQGVMGQPQAGQLKESRRPMPQGPPQGGLGGQRRGVPFQR